MQAVLVRRATRCYTQRLEAERRRLLTILPLAHVTANANRSESSNGQSLRSCGIAVMGPKLDRKGRLKIRSRWSPPPWHDAWPGEKRPNTKAPAPETAGRNNGLHFDRAAGQKLCLPPSAARRGASITGQRDRHHTCKRRCPSNVAEIRPRTWRRTQMPRKGGRRRGRRKGRRRRINGQSGTAQQAQRSIKEQAASKRAGGGQEGEEQQERG